MASHSAAAFRFGLLMVVATARHSFFPSRPYKSASARISSMSLPKSQSNAIATGGIACNPICIDLALRCFPGNYLQSALASFHRELNFLAEQVPAISSLQLVLVALNHN